MPPFVRRERFPDLPVLANYAMLNRIQLYTLGANEDRKANLRRGAPAAPLRRA
jgi:hypothetical protein